MPFLPGTVMQVMCGPWGDANCTGERWYNYMGSTTNGLSPFNVTYIYDTKSEEKNFLPYNKTTVPCNRGVPNQVCHLIHGMDVF